MSSERLKKRAKSGGSARTRSRADSSPPIGLSLLPPWNLVHLASRYSYYSRTLPLHLSLQTALPWNGASGWPGVRRGAAELLQGSLKAADPAASHRIPEVSGLRANLLWKTWHFKMIPSWMKFNKRENKAGGLPPGQQHLPIIPGYVWPHKQCFPQSHFYFYNPPRASSQGWSTLPSGANSDARLLEKSTFQIIQGCWVD